MKKVILVIYIAAVFLFSYKSVDAIINPFSLRIISIVPEIECLKINYDIDIINKCTEPLYIYDQGKFRLATYDDYALDAQYNKLKDFFYSQGYNNACSPGAKIILPNGIDWCDRNAVYSFFVENKTSDYLILGDYQDKFRLGANEEFVINYEMHFDRAYYAAGTQNNSNPDYIFFSMIVCLAVAMAIAFYFSVKERKIIKHKNK